MAKVQTSVDIDAPSQRQAGSSVITGHAEGEADTLLARLKQLAGG